MPLGVQVSGAGVCLDGINIFSICIHYPQIGRGAESNSQLISMEIEYTISRLRCGRRRSATESDTLKCVRARVFRMCTSSDDNEWGGVMMMLRLIAMKIFATSVTQYADMASVLVC